VTRGSPSACKTIASIERDAAQECDMSLSRLAVDAKAFDQDGLEARIFVVDDAELRRARLRTVCLPANEHERLTFL